MNSGPSRFQHTEADIDKHLAVFEEIRAHAHESAAGTRHGICRLQQDISREHSIIQEKTPLANEVITPPATREAPHLRRVLDGGTSFCFLSLLFFNLNVVPSIAANGGVTVWLWIISLILFFWPQGIAVIELAQRYPGEGGVYLWAKEVFGDFHGFSLRLVLLDQQYDVRSHHNALFRWRVRVCSGPAPCHARR